MLFRAARYIFLRFILLCLPTLLMAIPSLSLDGNMMCAGNREVIRTGYFHSGNSGKGCLWDFSDVDYSGELSYISCVTDSSGIMSVCDGSETNSYVMSDNVLKLVATESALKKVSYSIPQSVLCYPFAFGDTISSFFYGDGVYCHGHPFRQSGMVTVVADGEGRVVISEGDTIDNILRLHTVRTYSVAMGTDFSALDTASNRQVIEESFSWYFDGCRYPLFETFTSTSYQHMVPLGTTRRALCNLAGLQSSLQTFADKCNKPDSTDYDGSPQDESKEGGQEQSGEDPEIIHYKLSVTDKRIDVTYDLDCDASITTVVVSPTGITYRLSHWMQSCGEGYVFSVDCGSLRSGTYILYINVNGKIYSNVVEI